MTSDEAGIPAETAPAGPPEPSPSPEAEEEPGGDEAPGGDGATVARPRGVRGEGARAGTDRPRILLTGAASGLGGILLRRMVDDFDVVAVDDVDLAHVHRSKVTYHRARLGKREFDDVVRQGPYDAVIHISFRDDPTTPTRVRHQHNVIGTMRLLDACQTHDVRKVVILSSAAVYGAFHDNPTFIPEDHPLRASQTNSWLRDRVEVDTYVQAWMYKNPTVDTILLRPVDVLGRHVHSGIRAYLELPVVPVLIGFDPMTQILHEDDLARAILAAVEHRGSGIFNIVGPGALPLREIIRALDRPILPVPHPIGYPIGRILWSLGLSSFRPDQIRFLRYSQVVSGRRARRELGYEPAIPLDDCLRALRRAMSPFGRTTSGRS